MTAPTVSAVDGLAVVVFLGLVAYAVLGGADFGAGLWDLSRDRRQRELVARAMTPVWEANHVWLIFVVITLFTGFPGAFGALSRALAGPVSVALLGIVLRGAAFVFRQYGAPEPVPAPIGRVPVRAGRAPRATAPVAGDTAPGSTAGAARPVRGTALWGRVFAIASLLTPFAFGTAAGALAAGTPRADGSAGLWLPFVQPLPLVAGLLATTCCAYLAAVYLARDAERVGVVELVASFRRRALVTGVLAGTLALAALPLVPPGLGGELRGTALPAVLVSAASGVLGLVLLWRRRYGPARVAAAGAPTGLLAGWALGVYPWALPGQVPLTEAAASEVIAGPVLVVLVAGLALVAPCYACLIRVLRAQPD